MKGLKVKCLSCDACYHETTARFNPMTSFNGTMFSLLTEYGPAGHNWSSFPSDEAIMDADLECPGCGSCYVGNVRFVLPSGNSVSITEFRSIVENENRLNEKKKNPESPDLQGMSWSELRRYASGKGVFRMGMNKVQLLEALRGQEEARA